LSLTLRQQSSAGYSLSAELPQVWSRSPVDTRDSAIRRADPRNASAGYLWRWPGLDVQDLL